MVLKQNCETVPFQDILAGKAVDYETNSDYPGNFLMEKLCQLSLGEVRSILHKFVER